MNEINRITGARLRRARQAHGWPLRQAAEKSGVPFNIISRIERGQDSRFSAVAALAAALGVSLDELAAPSRCATCDGMPPAGFTCRECGTNGPEVTA